MLQISPVMKMSPKNEHAKIAGAGAGDGNRGQADRTKATWLAMYVLRDGRLHHLGTQCDAGNWTAHDLRVELVLGHGIRSNPNLG